ncbi:PDZ domain-containing protein [Niabella terrae]
MKKYILLATVFLPAFLGAQEAKEHQEAERIIITRKGNTDEKLNITVDGDKITVNGKPATDDEDATVNVRRMKIKDLDNFSAWPAPDARDGAWQGINRAPNKAMLGVLTGPDDKGARITQVTSGTAAEKAGLKTDDIITQVDDSGIGSPRELAEALKDKKPGDKVKITYLRDGKTQTTTAALTEWKGPQDFGFNGDVQRFNDGNFDLRELLGDLPGGPLNNGQMRRYRLDAPNWFHSDDSGPRLGLRVQDDAEGKGIKVLKVESGSDAEKAGLEVGDLVREVNCKAVSTTEALQEQLAEAKAGDTLKLGIRRQDKDRQITVELSRKLKTADL